jgi:uncharacterized damage-inducible protein DinB
MSNQTMEDLRYPIGPSRIEAQVTPARIAELIDEIAAIPAALRTAVAGLSADQLDTPYRPGGWTVRQVVHHLPDSHSKGMLRFRLGLTEEQPLVPGYREAAWAELADAKTGDIEISLVLLEQLHRRWVHLLRSLSPADFQRTVNHAERGVQTLGQFLQLYAWHGRHHTAQITALRGRQGW